MHPKRAENPQAKRPRVKDRELDKMIDSVAACVDMPEMTRRKSGFHSPSRPEAETSRLQFQVVMKLAAGEPCSEADLENALTGALDVLVREAQGVALGPVGGVNFAECEVELEFTVEAISPAVFYAKMGEILRVLEHAGFEWGGSREERIDTDRELDLQPA
jgi:hypothetical protein